LRVFWASLTPCALQYVDNLLARRQDECIQYLTKKVHATSGGGGGGPKNVLLLCDYSSSMTGTRITSCVSSMETIVKQHLAPGDKVALTLFTHEVKPVLPWALKGDQQPRILSTIRSSNQPKGGTAIWDALDHALTQPGPGGPFWIVLLTDGQDGHSRRANPGSLHGKLAAAGQAGQISGMIAITAGGGVGAETSDTLARLVSAAGDGELIASGDDVQVRITRRAHKYFPVHRAGVNTMHLSRAGGLQPRGGDHVGGPLGALAPCVSPQRFRWTKAIECTYTNSNESCVFLSR
jgi:hypothetical protein